MKSIVEIKLDAKDLVASLDRVSESFLAIEEKTKITPQMVESGLNALYRFNISEPDEKEMKEAVCAVFSAMMESRTTDKTVGVPSWAQEC